MSAETVRELAEKARNAFFHMNTASPRAKNTMLAALEESLRASKELILAANAKDLQKAEAAHMDAPRLDRLRITQSVIEDMCRSCQEVAAFPDPIGSLEKEWIRPNGIHVGKMRVPLGVIAMVYESRPNVTIDAAILCLKAGNSVILRGGSEAHESNCVLVGCLREALTKAGLPADAVQFVGTRDHEDVKALCALDEYIDVMIPRGGESLVRAVTEAARMPVLKHFKGVCHAYLDEGCDLGQALDIVYNAKVQRPGVCNALECVLVHESVAAAFLPKLCERLASVRFHACETSYPLCHAVCPDRVIHASPEASYGVEFHDLILAVKVVHTLEEALAHIRRYSSKHTDIICTQNLEHSTRFVREVDSAMVGVNVSTRFNDGGQLGLGAEIGISTSKLHAFGPMGVCELTTTKFVVRGNGQVREG